MCKQTDTRLGDKVVLTNVLSLSLSKREQGHCHSFGWAERKKTNTTFARTCPNS